MKKEIDLSIFGGTPRTQNEAVEVATKIILWFAKETETYDFPASTHILTYRDVVKLVMQWSTGSMSVCMNSDRTTTVEVDEFGGLPERRDTDIIDVEEAYEALMVHCNSYVRRSLLDIIRERQNAE